MSGLDLLSTYISDSEDDEINDKNKSNENFKRYLYIVILFNNYLLITRNIFNLNIYICNSFMKYIFLLKYINLFFNFHKKILQFYNKLY